MQGALLVIRERGPVVLALWGLAVAQPVLDLFGRNPEFFVANDIGTWEIVLFAFAVVLIGPLVLLSIQVVADAVQPTAGVVVHVTTVAVLGGAFALALVGQFDVDDAVIAVMVAAFVGALLAYVERTVQPVRRGLRYLALAPVFFVVAFLAFSSTSDLLLGDPSAAVEAGVVGREAPIVFLSLDEFPVASLLREDGTINAERFPNFARLAAAGTWYRNATSVASTTTQSVPATLTGLLPDSGELPTYRDHPRSLFTLLADDYDQHVDEQVTQLCPPSICHQDDDVDLGRVWTALTDASAVYGHAALPPSLRDWLPVVDRSWGDFIDGAASSSPIASDAPISASAEASAPEDDAVTTLEPDPSCPDIELWCGAARVSELIESIEPSSGRPDLYAVHATIPHFPWIFSPTGQQFGPRTLAIDGVSDNVWVGDTAVIRQAFQRHLLQVGAVDLLLGRLIDRLEEVGLWDEALVVVVADHGVAFEPGARLREPDPSTLHEIFNVPLFIKAPDQRGGEVETGNALTVDVLPTIVDLLDVETDWRFDGESLNGATHRPDKPAYSGGGLQALSVDWNGVLDVARRNQQYLPNGDNWLAVAAVGALGDRVGMPVTALDITDDPASGWSIVQADDLADWDPGSGQLEPILLEGQLESVGTLPSSEALVVLNGRVAGVAIGTATATGGPVGFRALLAEELLHQGANEVDLLVPTDASARSFRSLGPPDGSAAP